MNKADTGLGKRTLAGAGWMVLMRVSVRIVGLISTVILARLLVPADFGLITLAGLIYGAIDIMGEFSFDLALIHNQQADRRHYDTAWTLGVIRSIILAAIFVALAYPAAHFFDEPRLEDIVYVLSLGMLFKGFSNIGTVDFRKNLLFHKEFLCLISNKLIAFAVTITFAFLWRSYWALVAGILASQVAGVGLSYLMHPYRPRFAMSQWRVLIRFSKWLIFRNILLYANNHIDKFILGRLIGVQALGIYTVAREFGELPSAELLAPIQRALFPSYAKLQGDMARLRQAYLRPIAGLLMIIAPLGIGLALIAEPFVLVVLGPKWHEAVPLLAIFAICGVVRVCSGGATAICFAIGKPQIPTYLTAINLCQQLPIVFAGAYLWGAEGAAYGLLMSTVIMQVITLMVVSRVLGQELRPLGVAVWRTCVSVVVMGFLVAGMLKGWNSYFGDEWMLLELVSAIIVGGITYGSVHFGLWRLFGAGGGPEREILDAAKPLFEWFYQRRVNRIAAADHLMK